MSRSSSTISASAAWTCGPSHRGSRRRRGNGRCGPTRVRSAAEVVAGGARVTVLDLCGFGSPLEPFAVSLDLPVGRPRQLPSDAHRYRRGTQTVHRRGVEPGPTGIHQSRPIGERSFRSPPKAQGRPVAPAVQPAPVGGPSPGAFAVQQPGPDAYEARHRVRIRSRGDARVPCRPSFRAWRSSPETSSPRSSSCR